LARAFAQRAARQHAVGVPEALCQDFLEQAMALPLAVQRAILAAWEAARPDADFMDPVNDALARLGMAPVESEAEIARLLAAARGTEPLN